ncbi:MAG: hypothetical protein HY914_23375 [Desulfomonile tiedjei]|nr:hypothetical protein [Desulfomonile tiedjei]
MSTRRMHGVTVILAAWLAVFLCAGEALTYKPCSTPPVVSLGAGRPNLLLTVDFSGYQALPAFLKTDATINDTWIGNSDHYYVPDTNATYDSYVLDARDAVNVAANYETTANRPHSHTFYNPRETYYGIFKTDQYYMYDTTGHYFKLATTPPVTSFKITNSSDGGTNTGTTADGRIITNYYINFTTASAHGFAIGDLVVFSNMPSHTSLNGNAYEVTAVSGDTFTVRTMVTTKKTATGHPIVQSPASIPSDPVGTSPCVWNKTSDAPKGTPPFPDSAYGTVAKRVNTGMKFTTAISGNILNFMTMSRNDVTMKVLIGGREESPQSGDNYYIKGLGSRYFADFAGTPVAGRPDLTDLKAGFYVRPATLDGGATGAYYPDNYSTGSVLGKTSFLTVFGQYTGALDSGSLISMGEACEGWKFTAPFNATVKMTLNYGPTWPVENGARIVVYSDAAWTTQAVPPAQSVTGSVSLSLNVSAGTTYYVRVTTKDGTVWVPPAGTSYPYTLYSTVDLEPDTSAPGGGTARNRNGVVATAIGAIPFADVRIAIPKATWPSVRYGSTQCGQVTGALATCPRGIVQDTFSMVRWGFMFFNSWVTGDKKEFKGKLVVGCENRDLQLLLRGMQGISKKADGTTTWTGATFPYTDATFIDGWKYNFCYGTQPMGYAIRQSQAYFKMQTTSLGADNSLFTSNPCPSGTVLDPYKDTGCKFVGCRKSFLIMVASGTERSPDPSTEVSQLHNVDLRGEDSAVQDAKIYTIYTYGTDCQGANAMKTIAAFGGFTTQVSADKPYTWNSTPNDSKEECWPRNTSSIAGQCSCSKTGNANCNPDGTYDDGCKSWSTSPYYDRFNLGIEQFKGLPDNYYEASQGSLLADSLTKVLHDIVTVNASASAVATVSQEIKAEDIIVRGAFRAKDPDVDRNLWFGHLEAFWPDTTNNNTYDFEYSCNKGLLCYEMPGPPVVGATGAPCPSARSAYCWDAASFLNDPSAATGLNRRIFTGWDADNDGRIGSVYPTAAESLDFEIGATSGSTWSDWRDRLKLTTTDNDFYGTTGVVDQPDVQAFIDHLKGKEDTHYRSRADVDGTIWRMGDIVYSTPVVQGIPSLGAVSPRECTDCATSEYYDYRNKLIARRDAVMGSDPSTNRISPVPTGIEDCVKQMVYVGGNDGMVHAVVLGVWDWGTQAWHFKKDPLHPYAKYVGEELWSYIPSNLLSELKALASRTYGGTSCSHRAMVDLSESVWHVRIKADCQLPGINAAQTVSYGSGGKCWRTVLLGGQRGGGDLYFAIDVTNPDEPRLLWEYSAIKNHITYSSGKYYRYLWDGNSDNYKAMYDSLKVLPLSWSRPQAGRVALPSGSRLYTDNPLSTGNLPLSYFSEPNPRHVAFIGGGFRVFESSWQPVSTGPTYDLRPLQKPNLLAIDMETGQNLFRYVWPYLLAQTEAVTDWPTIYGGPDSKFGSPGGPLPYAMSDPLLLDLWDAAGEKIGDDGFADHLYMGDLTGYFYGIKFFFDQSHGQSTNGLLVNLRKTMPGQLREERCPTAGTSNDCADEWSHFFGKRQPITSQPVASIDQVYRDQVHVIFGTGKYDNTDSGSFETPNSQPDTTDPVRMSIYNLQETVDVKGDLGSKTKTYMYESVPGSSFNIAVNRISNCETFNNQFCRWRNSDNSADPCQSASPPCWSCIFDLKNPLQMSDPLAPPSGERVVNKALIAGGLLFITTYAPPSDLCSTNSNGYLYIFDYMCTNPNSIDFAKLLPNNTPTATFTYTPSGGTEPTPYGVQVSLGSGLPSQPVLDSSGSNVITQMSDASLLKIPVDIGNFVKGKAWLER